MIRKILTNKSLPLKERVRKSFAYFLKKRGAIKSWERRHVGVLKTNRNYNKKCPGDVENKHRHLWSYFGKNVDPTTLRICYHISGKADARIVPEDIFAADIEPTLITDSSVDYISNKSFYNRWFPQGIFPKDLYHRIDGQFFDPDLKEEGYDDFLNFAQNAVYPVVIKPSRGTYGGEGVHFVESSKELTHIAADHKDFVVQEKIEQHPFFNKFHPKGLNTIRVNFYRSTTNNNLFILNMALKMGKAGSLDNIKAGGIHSAINSSGYLSGYAVDKYGSKFEKHPDTGLKFNQKIPDFENLKEIVLKIGDQVFLTRLFGLDVCLDTQHEWRVIELNTISQSIRFSQHAGEPFFGEHTSEVVQYCKENHWAKI